MGSRAAHYRLRHAVKGAAGVPNDQHSWAETGKVSGHDVELVPPELNERAALLG